MYDIFRLTLSMQVLHKLDSSGYWGCSMSDTLIVDAKYTTWIIFFSLDFIGWLYSEEENKYFKEC